MKKSIPAFIAALLITAVLGAGMFLIGQDALGTSIAKAEAAATTGTVSADTVAQYEQVVAQYQTRESQYQAQLNQASQEINAANQQLEAASQQIQQYQDLLMQLQNSGLITISGDGTVTLNQFNQPGFRPFFGEHDDH